jgi:uncharacterized protein YdiU (UPF0061 family)
MSEVNPAYIPRNHRIASVLKAATEGNFAPFEKLRRVLENPFQEMEEFSEYEAPPAEAERVLATFCGT